MQTTKKKTLALFLSLVMILSLFSGITVFAAEEEEGGEASGGGLSLPYTYNMTDALVADSDFMVVAEYEGRYYAMSYNGSLGAEEVELDGSTILNSRKELDWVPTEDFQLQSAIAEDVFLFPYSGGMTYNSGRKLIYADGHLSWITSSGGSGYLTFDGSAFGYSTTSAEEAANILLFEKFTGFTLTDTLEAGMEYLVVADYEGSYYALSYDGTLGAEAVEVEGEGDVVNTENLALMWLPDGEDHLESKHTPGQFIFAGSGGFMTYEDSMLRVFLYNADTETVQLHTKYVLTFNGEKFDQSESAADAARILIFGRVPDTEPVEPEDPIPEVYPAPDAIVKDAVKNSDGSITLGFTSDIHYDGQNLNLKTWLEASGIEYIDTFGSCGDMGSAYASNAADFWSWAGAVMDYMDTLEDAGVVGNAVYTQGNHEWMATAGGDFSNSYYEYDAAKRLKQVGELVVTDDYIVYAFGAGEVAINNTYDYNTHDIDTLREYLETAPTDRPIFILTHFPLHRWESRTVKRAQLVVDALNSNPNLNLIVLWGHNHSNYDDYYYLPKFPGDEIVIDTKGTSCEINFTYLAAGCTADAEYTGPSAGSAATMNKGLIATINADGTIDYKYYTIDGMVMNIESPWMVRFRTGIDQYEVFETQYVDDGETVEAVEAPVLNGYDFAGWFYRDGGSEVEFDFEQPITRNILVTAKYDKIVLPVTEAAKRDPGFVYVTIQNQQETAIGTSGAPIALYRVPYEAGMTIGDAFVKVHELEFEGGTDGVTVEDSGYGAYYLTKVWGLVPEHGSWIFDPTSTSCYVDANAEAEPGACYYTLAYESAWKSTSFMNSPSVDTVVGETITMAAMTFAMDSSYNYSAEGMAGDVYCGTTLDDLALVDTTEDGYFDISFDAVGDYIIVVKGSFGDAMGFVSVKPPVTYRLTDALETDVPAVLVTEYEGSYYAMSFTEEMGKYAAPGAQEVTISGELIPDASDNIVWIPGAGNVLQNKALPEVFIYAGSSGLMTYTSGRAFVYNPETQHVLMHSKYWLVFDGSAFTHSEDEANATAFQVYGASNVILYTITFDANADGLDGLTGTKTEGEPYEITEALERSGYSFEGWNTAADGSGTTYAVGDTITEDADLTLYAQWEAEADELVISALTANTSFATVGETITWSAEATGGTGTLRYRFFVYQGSTQVYADTTYSAANTFRYAPTEAGTYRARVFVRDSAGTTVNLMGTNITVEAAVLTPGTIATAAATSAPGKITVSWSESDGATAYIIQRRVKDAATWTTLKSNVTGLSYEDTTGEANVVYQYRVRGRNGSEYGPFKVTSVVRAQAGSIAPGTIATASATSAPGKITVSWSESDGATAYIIQRRIKDDTTWTTLKSNVTGLSYEDTTGEAGVVYQYRIRGRDGTSYGPFKVTSVVRAQEGSTTPGTIATASATAAAGKITVSWSESDGATAYIIQRRVKDAATWTTLKSNVTGLSYEDATAEAGVVYQYRVRGRNGTVYGNFKVTSVVRAK